MYHLPEIGSFTLSPPSGRISKRKGKRREGRAGDKERKGKGELSSPAILEDGRGEGSLSNFPQLLLRSSESQYNDDGIHTFIHSSTILKPISHSYHFGNHAIQDYNSTTQIKLRGNSTRKRRRCRSRSEGVASTCFSDSSLQQVVNHVESAPPASSPPMEEPGKPRGEKWKN